MACKICEWWENTSRPAEIYRFAWGAYVFDVDAAKALALSTGREPVDYPTKHFTELVNYPETEKLEFAKVWINEEHLDHVSDDPILIVDCWGKLVESGMSKMVIDGHHRIARAIRDQVEHVKAYLIPIDEARSIMLADAG